MLYPGHLLYNDCWHGFWVCSWWPRVLWQAVTLWLVNRGMSVCRSRTVEQVCNRKSSQNWVEPGIHSRSEALGHLWRYSLQGGASVGTPWLQEEDMGARRSSLSEYISLHLSLKFTNCASLLTIKWEIYFYKEVCFVLSLKFVHYLWLCSWLGLWEVYNTPF